VATQRTFASTRRAASDIGVTAGELAGPPASRVALWSPEAGVRVVYRLGDVLPGAVLFRADGSALIVALRANEAVVVDLRTGAVSPSTADAFGAQ